MCDVEWDFVLENMSVIEFQAKRCVKKLGKARWCYEYDDLLHEGAIKAKEVAHLFNSTRGSSSTFVSTVVGRHLFMLLKKAIKTHNREGIRFGTSISCLFTDNAVEKWHRVPRIRPVYTKAKRERDGHLSPRIEQRRWLEFGDLHMAVPLTYDTFAFCRCLLDPPEELRIILSNQAVDKSPWKNAIEKLICNRLAIPKRQWPLMAVEIREKCELQCE